MDNMITEKEKTKLTVYKLLKKLGVSQECVGFNYLVDAITEKHYSDKSNRPVRIMDVYETLGYRYDKKKACIERAVRHVIIKLFDERPNVELMEAVFGAVREADHVANNKFIAGVSNYIRYEYDEKENEEN